jgi:lipoate-protein ligase A
VTAWIIQHSRGDAGAFHASDPLPRRSAIFHTVDRPTLVLGSAQTEAEVDGRVASALGVAVVRRRSGGGAVLLLPGEFVWLDLVVPATDPLWDVDVARAMVWVGDLWQRVLTDLGMSADVHRDVMVRTEWSRSVCWAGIGTGEVITSHQNGPGKLVGVSQRRTRALARFQTMCHLRWRPELVAALVAPPRPTAAIVAPWAAVVAEHDELQSALAAALPR